MAKKILIIDDEPHIVMLTKARLAANGYEVETASGGNEGIERAGRALPDLVLLDILMPEVDGYEVCRRLKGDSKTAEIPIIMFTACQEKELEVKCKKLGAVAVINKPYESLKLLELIQKILGEKC